MDSIRLLIRNGADVNAKTDQGFTPLHYAAAKGCAGIARLLIENGADVNAKTSWQGTPRSLAVQFGQKDIVGLLNETATPLRAHAARVKQSRGTGDRKIGLPLA